MATRAAARRCRWCRSSACRSRLSAAASGSRISSRSIPTASCRAMLGMGDVLSLIEKAEAGDRRQDDAEKLEEKLRTNEFTLEDFRDQLQDDPEDGAARADPRDAARDGQPQGSWRRTSRTRSRLARVEAIISSMTPDERRKQHIINGSRRKRIAKGSGTSVEEVNRLLKQFVQMQKMLKMLEPGRDGGGAARRGVPKLPQMRAGDSRRAWRQEARRRAGPAGLDRRTRSKQRSGFELGVRSQESRDASHSFASGRVRRRARSSASWSPIRASARDSSFVENPRALQPAHQAGASSRSTRSASSTGSKQGRAAVRFGATLIAQAPDARPAPAPARAPAAQ